MHWYRGKMARLCIVGFVVMCFIEATFASGSTVIQQHQVKDKVGLRETRDMNEAFLDVLINTKVRTVVDNVLGRMWSSIEQFKGSGHFVKTEICRLSKEMKKMKSERESYMARHSTEMKKLKRELKKLKRDGKSCKAGLSRMSSVTRRLRSDQKSVMSRNDFLENKIDRLSEEIDRLNMNSAQKHKIQSWDSAKVITDRTAYTAMTPTAMSPITPTAMTPKTRPPSYNFQRILMADYASSKSSYPIQMIIGSKQLSKYSYLKTSSIQALVYEPTENRIIFSRYRPVGILSSPLDRSSVRTLRRNVSSFGLAVDAGVMFLTTYMPSLTVARMGTEGANFRTVWRTVRDHRGTWSGLHGIALDRKQRVIYFCNGHKLLSVTYEGQDLATFHSGDNDNYWIYDVTLDDVLGFLYFNHGSEIMRRSLSGGGPDTVGEIEDRIFNLIYYNNTVYVSSYHNGNIFTLDIKNGKDTVTKLHSNDADGLVICLMP